MDSSTDSDSDSKLDGYIVLCRTFHIAPTRTQVPAPYFCTGLESEFEPVSGNVNEPFLRPTLATHLKFIMIMK